jgi:5-methylcytosine-specific restriction enzyme subunit McrC
MQIPIENIYYLLCYAWNKLDEKDQVKVAVDNRTDLLGLFARVLINGTRMLLKRGIDRYYLQETAELAGVKGKLELSATLKQGLHLKQKTICTIDEFSVNILSNRILFTTLMRMIKTTELERSLVNDLKSLVWMLPGIEPTPLSPSIFSQVRMHRNNSFYGFLLHICRIIYDNTLPTEKPGEWRFIDFTRDERQMNRLFESFLLNFYRKSFPAWSIRSEQLNWQLDATDPDHLDFLPRMLTDISITAPSGKTIIDAKYYSNALTARYENEKLKSENLYQLFSYLMNQRSTDPNTYLTKGILIYPTTNEELDLSYMYDGHSIQVKTVNLNTHWTNIEKRLKEILV